MTDEDKDEESYSTHLFDQIGAAKAETDQEFLDRLDKFEFDTFVNIPDELFENSYVGEHVPWLTDDELRKFVFSCRHLTSPQPVTIFLENPFLIHCDECAETVQTYKDTKNDFEPVCDLCSETADLGWLYATYQYFTLSGALCPPCIETQKITLEASEED